MLIVIGFIITSVILFSTGSIAINKLAIKESEKIALIAMLFFLIILLGFPVVTLMR
ncbi:hypothetical protein [Sabulibacter ruber]|uniref:hypothetical protein n=1 Tax=Sabulibacter ruber TaxID=2811901 RepID=UPI001A975068|nr:hypothetical protein [Sabulibacter ruber]